MINPKLSDDLPEKCTISEAIKITSELVYKSLLDGPDVIKDMTSHLQKAVGKGIRTTLLIHTAADENGLVSSDSIRSAAAIEIMHLATLVHDDIMDDADLRRGIESVQKKFGKKQAVICGDYLFCLAFSTISSIYLNYSNYVLDFSQAISKVCLGELKQFKNNNNLELTIRQYMHIISGKTAALFWISAYAGAIIAGRSEKDAKLLGMFGKYLGIIFQIIDDCKDFELTEKQTLKTVNNDIAQGVVTLPLIMAFVRNPELKKLANNVFYNNGDLFNLINQVYLAGGTKESRNLAHKYSQKATKTLELVENFSQKEALLNILSKALESATKF